MLLAGLEGQAEGGLASGVLGHADKAARHAALMLVLDGEEGGVRAAVAERDAKALAVAEGNVGTELAGRFE
ncbi:hypothetical protein BC937DRAFT_87660 [Endogone sp. FLAS-F59071]|nr:hypothetical protein BC937DRAFT_87660 [Endogone sp. FLAS-F59071]|eukprot:RUS19336.1 hypothetical protein BC937DRAFT_87660 [Endogone sp. FLAS-F59071]